MLFLHHASLCSIKLTHVAALVLASSLLHLDSLVCLQAVTLAKYSSPCCPLSLPLRLPTIPCLDF